MPRRGMLWLVTALLVAGAAACGGGTSSTSTTAGPTATSAPSNQTTSEPTTQTTAPTPNAVDPCSLLTVADVQELDPSIGAGKIQTVGPNQICDWPDAQGIAEVQLQVFDSPGTTLQEDLSAGLPPTGYDVVAVDGLGDEAAAAFQQADASKGLSAGLAYLEARKGNQVVGISMGPSLTVTQGSPEFDTVKKLAAKALAALG